MCFALFSVFFVPMCVCVWLLCHLQGNHCNLTFRPTVNSKLSKQTKPQCRWTKERIYLKVASHVKDLQVCIPQQLFQAAFRLHSERGW